MTAVVAKAVVVIDKSPHRLVGVAKLTPDELPSFNLVFPTLLVFSLFRCLYSPQPLGITD